MNSPTYWQQVEALFQAALEQAPDDRARFLELTCGTDEQLRAEVASLLAAHEGEASLLDQPAPQLAARLLAVTQPASLSGQSIRQYHFLKLLGQGGMGEVWLAHDEKLQRQVAIKALTLNPLSATQGQTRVLNEAQASARLNHPNVCTVYEVLEAEARCFIVMQYIEGETLAERLKRGRLPWHEAVELATQIADALMEAHAAGIIHRDIKPQNVMLDQRRPRRDAVKVLDFGIAESRQRDEETKEPGEVDAQLAPAAPSVPAKRTTPGLIFGTPGYLAPEQALGAAVDARSDLFSLGVVLFEMLTGTAPFEAESSSEAIARTLNAEPPPLTNYLPQAPAPLISLVQKALAKQPDERYQTAAELLADLRQLHAEGHAAEGATPNSARFKLRRWQAVAAMLLVALLAATLFLLARRQSVSSTPEPKFPVTPAAYEAYQKGRAALSYDSGGHGIRKEAVEHFTRVIELEPNFAPAYAALALAYNNLHDHEVPSTERIPKAKEAALKALALDYSLAEAHITLAELYFEYEWRFAEALREYELAIQYDPNKAETYARYGTKLAEVGRFAEAQQAMQRAAQLEPYSEHQDGHRATVLLFARQYDQLITHAQQMLSRYGSRSSAQRHLGQAYLGKGQYEQALELLTQGDRNQPASPTVGVAYALAGRRDQAVQIAERLRTTTQNYAFSLARIYAALGETETALNWLEQAYARREVVMITLKADLAFDRIRSSPRFIELLRRVGFPP
jgi:serine/threonine protein kinase/Flp pilus assembly protein TadD